MSHPRFTAALSIATVIAAASAVAMSAANAQEFDAQDAYSDEQVSSYTQSLTAGVSSQLAFVIADQDLPKPAPKRLAQTRLHGGPVRIANLSARTASPSAASPFLIAKAYK